MIYNNLTNDDTGQITVFDPILDNGWSNGRQVVPAPNYDDLYILRWYNGFINMKQINIPKGFVYHKIIIPNYVDNNCHYLSLIHETTKLSNNSFITGDANYDEYDTENNCWRPDDRTTNLKEDGIGYVYYMPDILYLCCTNRHSPNGSDNEILTYERNSDRDFLDKGYDNSIYFDKVAYKIEYTFFIKLDSSKSQFYNYPISSHIVGGMGVYYKRQSQNLWQQINSVPYDSKHETDYSDQYQYTYVVKIDDSQINNSHGLHHVKTIYLIRNFEDNADNALQHKDVTFYSRLISLGKNLSEFINDGILDCSGYITIRKYIRESYNNYTQIWITNNELNTYFSESERLNNIEIGDNSIDIIYKFDSFANFPDNNLLLPKTGTKNIFATDFFDYVGCFSNRDIDDTQYSIENSEYIASTHLLQEIESNSAAILNYNKIINRSVKHDVNDLSFVTDKTLMQILKDLDNAAIDDVHDERDIMFGQYTRYYGENVYVYMDPDMFKVKTAKLLTKK